MSEEVAQAIGDIATVEQLHTRVLEWEDAYDRLSGAFDLHLAIGECQSALSDYAGVYYDVVLGALVEQLERAETSRKAWTQLGAQAQADVAALRSCLADTLGFAWTIHRVDQVKLSRDVRERANALIVADHPGAQLLAELEAARAVVEAQRQHLGCMADDEVLDAAMDAYDNVTKARNA